MSGRARLRLLILGSLAGLTVGALVAAWGRWLDVVEVAGQSMQPTLQPGDRLFVEALSYRFRRPLDGELVLAADPRHPQRELVKRVVGVGDGRVRLLGDAEAASTDSRTFGSLAAADIVWRVAFRYGRGPAG